MVSSLDFAQEVFHIQSPPGYLSQNHRSVFLWQSRIEDALQKARLPAESSETTLRIGTSLLYKCRMLPDLWPKVNEIQPDLKIEIWPMKEYEHRTTVFSRLGLDFDLFEGIGVSEEPDAFREKMIRRIKEPLLSG